MRKAGLMVMLKCVRDGDKIHYVRHDFKNDA
jgi:hypothetical protein